MSLAVRTTIVLPEEKLRSLKRLAFEQGSSLGKLVNEALDKVFFKKTKHKKFSELRGLWRHASITEADIAKVRIKEPRH